MTLPPIALTGKMRSGKDTVAGYLVKKYGYVRFAFGDELKRYAHELFGDTDAKPRELYQWFGQTMRERENDVWVRKCFEMIETSQYSRRLINEVNGIDNYSPIIPVISDLRQPNEYDRCRAEGYVIIKVVADDDTRLERMRASGDVYRAEDLTHETERHIDYFEADYYVNNNANITVDELYTQVDDIVRDIATKGRG